MGHLSNLQKETCKTTTLAWLSELEQNRKEGKPLRNYEEEGKTALRNMELLKAKYASEKNPDVLLAYNEELGKALASVTLLYKVNPDIKACANLNHKTKNVLAEKFGIDAGEVRNLLAALSSPTLKNRDFLTGNEAAGLVEEQLNTPEKVEEKQPLREEVPTKAKEAPVSEKAPKEEPVAEPVAPAKKEPEWQKQTNLPNVNTTIPAAVVEGTIRLIKPEKEEDIIPFTGSEDAAAQAKSALNVALTNRKIFQSERSQKSKDTFYLALSTALLHYSRLTAVMDGTAARETFLLRSRFQNEFGILEKDLKRANTVVYKSEKTVAQAWAHGDEAKIEDRLLKIGAPELQTTEIQAQVHSAAEDVKSSYATMPTEEFGEAEEISTKALRIEDEEEEDYGKDYGVFVEPTAKKPENPAITEKHIQGMKAWKEKIASQDQGELETDFLLKRQEIVDDLHSVKRDDTVGKLLAMADKVKDSENNYVYNSVKNLLWENANISNAEFDVALSGINKANGAIMKDLKNLKKREFDDKYKVPDAVKNFKYSKQMIDVNSKFFDNNYDVKGNDFLAFARAHMEALQNKVKNPPLAEEGNPEKELFDASVGMYARIRSSYDKRKWYDVLFHPIDSYRERSLMNSMKETMKQNGMNDAKIESLYTEAKEIFGLDNLSNSASLNGKLLASEANDKLVDVEEENPQIEEDELSESLNQEFKEFHGLEQKTESKEMKAPTVESPSKNNLKLD